MDYENNFLMGFSFLLLGLGLAAGWRLRLRRVRGEANFFDYLVYLLIVLVLLMLSVISIF
jgi:hypothetical protein